MILVVCAVILLLAAAFAFGERLLFQWYQWEIRRAVVVAAPGEAVISYPLA